MKSKSEPSPLRPIQTERIAACFLQSIPSDDDIRRARLRFLSRHVAPRRLGSKALLITIVQGLVLGLASGATAAFVAERASHVGAPSRQADPTPISTSANRVRDRGVRAKAADRAPAPIARARFADLAPEPASAAASSAKSDLNRVASKSVRKPATRPSPAETSAPHELTRKAAPSVASNARSVPTARVEGGSWERVAKALEANDWRGADNALNELSRGGDAHARDAAALARAQIWIAQGRREEVRATLQHLAQHAQTALIRRRASDLLQQL